MKLTFITQNCHGLPFTGASRRFAEIARRIGELQPDVVFLQEVIFPWEVRHFAVPGYALMYHSALAVYGGLVTMVKKSLEPEHVHWETYDAQGRIFSQQFSDRLLGKGFLATRIAGGVLLVNTHLLCTYCHRFCADRGQERQLSQLQRFLARHPRYVLGGDLNFDEGTPFYRRLVPPLADPTQGMGVTYPFEAEKFDFILTRGLQVPASEKGVVDYRFEVSDHKGIRASLTILDI